MSHHIDINSIHQNIFYLLNLCHGAKPFARNHDISPGANGDAINETFYREWLRFSLTQLLLDSAIKTRVLFDIIKQERKRVKNECGESRVDPYAIDDEISARTHTEVTIRQCCNKIIHALDVRPIFERGEDEHELDEELATQRAWEYWDGTIDLRGEYNGEWTLNLHIAPFCEALEEFVQRLEEHLPDK